MQDYGGWDGKTESPALYPVKQVRIRFQFSFLRNTRHPYSLNTIEIHAEYPTSIVSSKLHQI
jgi:hypothetical protein